MQAQDSELIDLIKQDNPDGFKLLYEKYYTWLCRAAYTIVKSKTEVEDVVQEVFMEVWKKKDVLNVDSSFKYYLRRSVINRSLNHIKKERKRNINIDDVPDVKSKALSVHELIEQKELRIKIENAVNTLPEKRRQVFLYSRYDDLSYKEIAQKMNISIKTVENQISAALKTLREILK